MVSTLGFVTLLNQFYLTMNNYKPSFTEKYAAILKVASIGILILLLLIPTGMIRSLIREREQRQQEAVFEISSKWGNTQTITGPIITIPYYSYYKDQDDKLIKTTSYAHFLPEELNIDAQINPEKRYRGIYEVVVYNSNLKLSGSFNYPDMTQLNINEDDIIWNKAFISIGIPDMRGIQDNIKLQLNDDEYAFNPGVDSKDIIGSGIHSYISFNEDTSVYNFSLDINLNGSEMLSFIPVGES